MMYCELFVKGLHRCIRLVRQPFSAIRGGLDIHSPEQSVISYSSKYATGLRLQSLDKGSLIISAV